jgi:predicted branched-subunit amino acid permease
VLNKHKAMHKVSPSSTFARGFRAILPLWFGAVPIAVAFAIAARSAGLSVVETQLLSLTVFSAGAQLSAIALIQAGASGYALMLTAAALNMHQLLLGYSLGRRLALSRIERWIAAYFLNDGAYGVAMASRAPEFLLLLGAELSMFIVWNIATLLGALAGHLIPDLSWLGVDFVAPLLFLALLVPLVRTWADLVAAISAGTLAVALTYSGLQSIAVLVAVAVASVVGAWCASAGLGRSRPADQQER